MENLSKKKKITCGIIIESQNTFFLGKVSGGNGRWDIPKGVMEEGESPLDTALRECVEESSMDLSSYKSQIKDLGQIKYLPEKDIHLFHLILDKPFDKNLCKCESMVILPNRDPFPEICGYDWMVYEKFINVLGKNLQRVIKDLNLNKNTKKQEKVKNNESRNKILP
jgi:putative (di)nucleoside polyphosphate hydrolase